MHHDQISRRLPTFSAATARRGSNWPMRLPSLVNAALGLNHHRRILWERVRDHENYLVMLVLGLHHGAGYAALPFALLGVAQVSASEDLSP